MKQLSEMRSKILSYIEEFTKTYGYPPSVREIGQAVGLKSPSTVHSHIKILKDAGYIEKDGRKTRAVTLVGKKSPFISVPVIGRVAAGEPILAYEEVLDYVPHEPSAGEFFGLLIRGDSMKNAGILDGDTVIVRKQNTAIHNEIVVALLGEEATVKRLSRKNGEVWLMPENEAYKPIDGREARIMGKVTAVYRRY